MGPSYTFITACGGLAGSGGGGSEPTGCAIDAGVGTSWPEVAVASIGQCLALVTHD